MSEHPPGLTTAAAALGPHSVRARIVAVWQAVRATPPPAICRVIERARLPSDSSADKAIRVAYRIAAWDEVPMQSGQTLFGRLAAELGCSDCTVRLAFFLIARAVGVRFDAEP